jgi:hypothetical protein
MQKSDSKPSLLVGVEPRPLKVDTRKGCEIARERAKTRKQSARNERLAQIAAVRQAWRGVLGRD